MTGYAFASDRDKCMAAGMDDYICKPIRVADLQTALETWGKRREATAAPQHAPGKEVSSGDDLIDTKVLDEVRQMPSSSDATMLEELIDLYLESVPERIAAIRNALGDGERLAFAAHSLKSMSLHLGAKKVVAIAGKLEDAGRSGHPENALSLLRELEVVFARTRMRLVAFKEKRSC